MHLWHDRSKRNYLFPDELLRASENAAGGTGGAESCADPFASAEDPLGAVAVRAHRENGFPVKIHAAPFPVKLSEQGVRAGVQGVAAKGSVHDPPPRFRVALWLPLLWALCFLFS